MMRHLGVYFCHRSGSFVRPRLARSAISCGDAPTRAWRESDSKFHGVYIDSAELTLNTFAQRAGVARRGGGHARRFVERLAFVNRDLSRPSLFRSCWQSHEATSVALFEPEEIEQALNSTEQLTCGYIASDCLRYSWQTSFFELLIGH